MTRSGWILESFAGQIVCNCEVMLGMVKMFSLIYTLPQYMQLHVSQHASRLTKGYTHLSLPFTLPLLCQSVYGDLCASDWNLEVGMAWEWGYAVYCLECRAANIEFIINGPLAPMKVIFGPSPLIDLCNDWSLREYTTYTSLGLKGGVWGETKQPDSEKFFD